jgi:hypothetical protein
MFVGTLWGELFGGLSSGPIRNEQGDSVPSAQDQESIRSQFHSHIEPLIAQLHGNVNVTNSSSTAINLPPQDLHPSNDNAIADTILCLDKSRTGTLQCIPLLLLTWQFYQTKMTI